MVIGENLPRCVGRFLRGNPSGFCKEWPFPRHVEAWSLDTCGCKSERFCLPSDLKSAQSVLGHINREEKAASRLLRLMETCRTWTAWNSPQRQRLLPNVSVTFFTHDAFFVFPLWRPIILVSLQVRLRPRPHGHHVWIQLLPSLRKLWIIGAVKSAGRCRTSGLVSHRPAGVFSLSLKLLNLFVRWKGKTFHLGLNF